MSPMVTLNFIMINLTVIFLAQQIHVNKVLFCCCCLLLFQTWGSLLNQSYSKENKLGSVTILMKLLVTIGDQSELKIGFPAAPGSQ